MPDKFIYDEKETYSQEDVKALLEQHSGFVSKGFKGYVSQEDHEKVLSELKPFKSEARKKHIGSLVGELTSENLLGDAIALAGITEEDDDSIIKTKVSETIKSRPWLQKDAGTPIEVKKEVKKPVTKKKEAQKVRRFVK